MSVSATVTGVTGPEQAVTAIALPNITNIEFDYVASIVKITYTPNDSQLSRTLDIALASLTTITDTITGANHVWVFS